MELHLQPVANAHGYDTNLNTADAEETPSHQAAQTSTVARPSAPTATKESLQLTPVKSMAGYTATGELAIIDDPARRDATSTATTPTNAVSSGATQSGSAAGASSVAYDAKAQLLLVSGGDGSGGSGGAPHTGGNSSPGVPDGVYVGFEIPGVHNKSTPHEFVEVKMNGHSHVFEYGPEHSSWNPLITSPLVEKNKQYHDRASQAGALFELTPPPGESLAQFEEQTYRLGRAMDNTTAQLQMTYNVLGPNCYSAADAILLNDGVSMAALKAMGDQAAKNTVGILKSLFQEVTKVAASTPTMDLTGTVRLMVVDAENVGGSINCDWKGDASYAQVPLPYAGPVPDPQPFPSEQQMQFAQKMAILTAGSSPIASLIGTTVSTLLGFAGGEIDFSKPLTNTDSALQVTLSQIDQIMGALEDAMHGGNVPNDLFQIAQALYARNPKAELAIQSAQQIYSDFQEIGKGPQQTIDGILSLGQDVLDFGHVGTQGLTSEQGRLFNDLGRAKNLAEEGFAAFQTAGNLANAKSPIAIASDVGQIANDLHLDGKAAKDYFDVLNGIGDLSQIGHGGFLNITEGAVNLGDTFAPASSEFGKWLHLHGQDVLNAASALEEILGGGMLNIAQGSADLVNVGEDLVKTGAIKASSALGSWLTKNGLKFTGIVGGIASIIQGFEQGGVEGGVSSGVGADVLLTSIGASGGLATPVAIVIGILTIAFGGHHDNPATMPDKYDTQRYGQMDADITGSSHPSGQNFTEDPTLNKLFGGRTGIQAIEETLAYYKTKANAPGWLEPLWDQLSAMFGENAQGNGHLSIGINGTGKDCNNQQVTGVAGTDGKVYQYTQLGGMVYAFAAALAQGTRGQGLAAESGYTGAYPKIGGLDWHAVRSGAGFAFYAEDTSNFGNFYSYDPSNHNLYYSQTSGVVGGTWVGDVRTYDFKNHSAIDGQAPPTPNYGGIAWHGFSQPQGGIAYWGAFTTKETVTIPSSGTSSDPTIIGPHGIMNPRLHIPHTVTTYKTTYYYFGADGNLYTGEGPGSLADETLVGNVASYNFAKGGNQVSAPIRPPKPISTPVPKPAPSPTPAPVSHLPAPSPVKPPIHVPPFNPVEPPKPVLPFHGVSVAGTPKAPVVTPIFPKIPVATRRSPFSSARIISATV